MTSQRSRRQKFSRPNWLRIPSVTRKVKYSQSRQFVRTFVQRSHPRNRFCDPVQQLGAMLKSASVYHVANRRCAGDVARPAVTPVSSRSLKPSSTTRHSVVACKAAKIHDYTRCVNQLASNHCVSVMRIHAHGMLRVSVCLPVVVWGAKLMALLPHLAQ